MDGWGITLLVLGIHLLLYILSWMFGWADTLWGYTEAFYASILISIAAVLYTIYLSIRWIFTEISSFGKNIYSEASEHTNYGLVLGAIIIVAILLNYASYNPEAETTELYKYLYLIVAILGSAFTYMLFSSFTSTGQSTGIDNIISKTTVLTTLLIYGLLFGAVFYFYSNGFTYPLLSIFLCGLVYLALTQLGTTLKYVIMALLSVSIIFGISLYFLTSDTANVPSTITYALSGILTFAVIVALAILFYFYSNYLKTVGGWKGWVINFLFYVPCLLTDFISYIKREIGLTSHLVYYLFLIEIVAALLYIYIPQIATNVVASEGTQLLAETAFLDIKKEIGTGYDVAFKNTGLVEDAVTTFKRSYSISMWIYLNPQPPNYVSYANETEIFNYGNGLPKITYINNVDTDGTKTPDVLRVYYTNKGGYLEQSHTVNIKPQKWNQIVFNYTSSQVDLFINGHLEKTFVFNKDVDNPTLPEYLPSDVISVGSTDGLDGAICNIKYHYAPQSKGQIATSYNLLMKQNPPINIL